MRGRKGNTCCWLRLGWLVFPAAEAQVQVALRYARLHPSWGQCGVCGIAIRAPSQHASGAVQPGPPCSRALLPRCRAGLSPSCPHVPTGCSFGAFSGGASWGFGEDAINDDDDRECLPVCWR